VGKRMIRECRGTRRMTKEACEKEECEKDGDNENREAECGGTSKNAKEPRKMQRKWYLF